MDKVVYQKAVELGKGLVRDLEGAKQEGAAASRAKPLDFELWRDKQDRVCERQARLREHIQFVKLLLEPEGVETLVQFDRDIRA